jgi:hypothetical protein
MAIWKVKFVDFDQQVIGTASMTLEDQGNGHASGTLRNLSGPVPVTEIDLSGVVRGNEFVVGGSVQAVGINLYLTFSPYVFSFTGAARIAVHQPHVVSSVFVVTSATE